MAQYEHLPVYKESYDLLLEIFKAVKDFQREYKFTIGESLKTEAVEMIKHIYRANSSYRKKRYILLAQENIETIRLFFRVLKDLRQIDLKRFVRVNERIECVAKQLSGWLKVN